MYSSFHRLFPRTTKSYLPLLSVTFLSLIKKSVRNSTIQDIQSQQQPTFIHPHLHPLPLLKQKHPWHWEKLIYIHSPQQLSPSDILEKTIIVYQMTGNNQIDSQVALISHLFCQRYFGKISERFQFVFLTPNPNSIQEELMYVIFSKQGTKYVPLKRYVSTLQKRRFIPNYQPLMNRLVEEVNKYHELSADNLSEYLPVLNCEGRDTYQLVVIAQNDSEEEIQKSKNVMEKFLKNRQIWNSQIVKSIVTDKLSRGILGLNRSDIQPNKVYLISPLNENLIKKPQKKFKILSKSYTIIPAEQIQEQFVFPPIPPQLSQQSYILKFNIDLNQIRPDVITYIYDIMRDQKLLADLKIPKLLTFSNSDQGIQITIEKNNHDNIVHAYDEGCMYDEAYKRDLLINSNIWKYPEEKLDPQKLREFVDTVVSNPNDPQTKIKRSLLEYFKSEPVTESMRHNSRLIVGEQRKEIMKEDDNKLIFHYSKSCHSCKKFKGTFEEVAGETKDVKFYRIDNDSNKTEGLKNYNSTPIFVMYKKGCGSLPWYFKMPYFTKKLFSSFVDITKEIQVIDPTKFKSHITEHQEHQSLVKQTLKEVI